MADAGGLPPTTTWTTPPPPPPPAAPEASVRPGRAKRFLIAGLAAVVVAAATAGGIIGFRLLRGSADSLVGMAPSDTVVYVNVHLDPSAGQKLAVNTLLDKFPSLSGSARDNTINGWIDQALQGTGLNHSDVRSWLGSDISFVVPASAFTQGSADAAVLLASTNDTAAQAAVEKLRQGGSGAPAGQWTTSTYNGVTLYQASGGAHDGVYAVANHTLVIGGTPAVVHEVIDTTQGKHARLESSGTYSKSVGEVTGDRIGLVYADVGTIAQQALKTLGTIGGSQPSLDALKAYGGAAVAISAHNDGVSVDGVADFDPSKLTDAERAQATMPPHVNGSVAYMPKSAYAALAATGLKQTVQSLVDQAGSAGGIFGLGMLLQQLGLTGPNSIVDHLTGDGGAELAPVSSGSTPGGAVVVGTDSQSAAEQFVGNLVQSVCGGTCDTSQVTRQDDAGVVISSLREVSSGLAPSWAVDHGWIIVGSSAEQVKAAVDAHRSGTTLSSSPDYQAVMSHVGTSNNGMAYVDIQALLGAIRTSLSPGEQSSFDSTVATLKPVHAAGLATRNSSDHVSISVFTLVR
jgi:hypothetical protein